jgi:hypothetical protein
MYGLFVYSFQGQFTLPLAFQGVSKQSWQDLGNVLALITGLIAAGLYGNIGISCVFSFIIQNLTELFNCLEVAYYTIVEEWFKGPPLMSRKGRITWTCLYSFLFLFSSTTIADSKGWIVLVIIYWALAFVVASAIPQVQTISGLVAAICIMQFTYTFPPLMLLGYNMRIAANGLHKADREPMGEAPSQIEAEDPGDTWRDFSRWKRAFFGGNVIFNVFNLVLFLGSLAMACLGTLFFPSLFIQKLEGG